MAKETVKRVSGGSKNARNGARAPSSTVTSVRVLHSEMQEFEALCAQLGVKRNAAIRAIIRQSAGYLEPDREVVSRVRDIQRQITGAARNLNQLARVANRTSQIDVLGLEEDRTEFVRLMLETNCLLQEFLNVAKRRSDGHKLISEIANDCR